MAHTFGITDIVSYQRQDTPLLPARRKQARITGFYKIAHHLPDTSMAALLSLPPDPIARLVPCHLDDPELAVVDTTSVCGAHHRPWDLTWEGPISWTGDLVAQERTDHHARVAQGYDTIHGLSSRSYPELFAQFPPLTDHQRLAIASWVTQCRHASAQWTAPPHP